MTDNRGSFLTIAHTALRVAAGLAFFTHGAQKLFGWFGGMGPDGGAVPLMSQFGAAGVIEVVAGLGIALGLFTRPLAFIASGEMAVAYFMVHWGGSGKPFWWANGGELALLYSFLFLWMSAAGAGPYSVDAQMKRSKTA